MKKYTVFLILILAIIALQLSISGLSFAFDKAELAERSFQLRESENCRPGLQNIRTQKTESILIMSASACLFEPRMHVFIFNTHKKCSVFISELFNNSPPAYL